MPIARAGFFDVPDKNISGSVLLVAHGPTIYVHVGFEGQDLRSAVANAASPADLAPVPALVDTGATECCIDSALARDIGLPLVDRGKVSGVGGEHDLDIYLAQLYCPSLDFRIYGRFTAVHLAGGGQVHKVLIGRTFLSRMILIYNGLTGNVEIGV